jgi:GPH family glycoside/pentoside/hexuronide:cation symporter
VVRAPVSLGVKVAYGLPGMAGAAMAIPIAIHLTIFYSDEVLVPLGLIALVKAVARAFDALTDPLMGWVSDRTRSRWGRRRPWMFVGAPLAALAFIAMFSPPSGLSPMSAAGWFAATYTAYYLFHTVYQIPHYGLGPEITQDYRERASLYGWSEGFSVVGTLVAAIAPWALGRVFDGERATFTAFALVFGGLLTLFYWNLVARVRERPDYVERRPNPLVPGVRRVMRNHAFRLLLFIYLVGAVTGAIPGLMMPYFTKYVIVPDEPGLWLAVFLATYFGSAFACMPLWVFAVKRFGKKPVWIFSFVSVILGLVALFVLVGRGDVLPMALILAWTGSTFSARLLLAPAMQADVIDYDELRRASAGRPSTAGCGRS